MSSRINVPIGGTCLRSIAEDLAKPIFSIACRPVCELKPISPIVDRVWAVQIARFGRIDANVPAIGANIPPIAKFVI